MNKHRWQHPDIPIAALALKLSEEASEVGNVITDVDAFLNTDEEDFNKHAREHLLLELDHVEFFVGLIRARIGKA